VVALAVDDIDKTFLHFYQKHNTGKLSKCDTLWQRRRLPHDLIMVNDGSVKKPEMNCKHNNNNNNICIAPLKSNLPGALYRVKEHKCTNELNQLNQFHLFCVNNS
jgi:hypothetical protein